jgi:hypothetical protein
LKLLECPKWGKDPDSTLPGMALAASAFLPFFERQNPKKYLLTHGDIKDWHKKLFQNAAPVPYYAGNFRKIDAAKPCLGQDVNVGGIPGAPFAQVESLMKKFAEQLGKATTSTDEYLDVPRTPTERIRAAAQIAAFAGGGIIHIHPFLNGNGRMARFTMNFFLHRYLNKTPFFMDRPKNPDYSVASMYAMRDGIYIPLYQYLIEILVGDF